MCTPAISESCSKQTTTRSVKRARGGNNQYGNSCTATIYLRVRATIGSQTLFTMVGIFATSFLIVQTQTASQVSDCELQTAHTLIASVLLVVVA